VSRKTTSVATFEIAGASWLRLCVEPGCVEAAVSRGRCPAHRRERNRRYRKRVNRKVYDSAKWRYTRRRQLFNEPLCENQGCDRITTDVHHRRAIQDGGEVWSLVNLQPLCHSAPRADHAG
jgi:hypothetical protein